MPFDYSSALSSIGASMRNKKNSYTNEMIFLIRGYNIWACMGGPNYNPGTEKIIDDVFDESPREAVRLLYLAVRISNSHLDKNIGYKFLWNLYKSCGENVPEFIKQLEKYPVDEHCCFKIPESVIREFEEF